MKSIKEKAEEYSSGYMNLDRQQVAKQALEYGANYVLDVVECILLDKNLDCEETYNELIALVEQLNTNSKCCDYDTISKI